MKGILVGWNETEADMKFSASVFESESVHSKASVFIRKQAWAFIRKHVNTLECEHLNHEAIVSIPGDILQ